MGKPTIALLTDFGLADNYVGIMKGVALTINPDVQLIDLTHGIEAQNIFQAALALRSAHKFFPKGTVFVCVVDPGVGSSRRPIIVQTQDYLFVGPDNGVFSFVLGDEKDSRIGTIWTITNDQYFLKPLSKTFHGRDIFMPVAAHLSKGTAPDHFGPRQSSAVRLEWPAPKISQDKREIIGQIIDIDRFGNLITNIENERLQSLSGEMLVTIKGRKVRTAMSYAEGKKGELLVVPGSKDLLEISVNHGSAQELLRCRRGDRLAVQFLYQSKTGG